MIKSKELIISPKVQGKAIGSFLSRLKKEGINSIYADPAKISRHRNGLNVIYESDDADSVVCTDVATIRKVKRGGKLAGFYIRVTGKKDE
ncbi:MAG: hypothetical protein ACE5JV_03035, partial [Nitrososphaerales archaeon]